MGSAAKLISVDEFLSIPESPTGHYEFHHGQVILIAPPKVRHEKLQERVRLLLSKIWEDRWIIRVEMAFQPSPEHEFWRADVGVISLQRDAASDLDGYLQGAPDLVVEVLSPSNSAIEMNDKLNTCLENGCQSFWVVDPLRETVTESGTVKTHKRGSVIESKSFGVTLPIDALFAV